MEVGRWASIVDRRILILDLHPVLDTTVMTDDKLTMPLSVVNVVKVKSEE